MSILAGLVIAGGAAGAVELPGEEHEPLIPTADLTLGETVDAALVRYPDRETLSARVAEAAAWADLGSSWFSAQPALALRYQTDRFGSDDGLKEFEAGVELALWRPGGRRATRFFGDALADESQAAAGALRWEVAGHVRRAFWDVGLAANERDLAREATVAAGRLVQIVERRHELGDVALRDVLMARVARAQAQTGLIAAEGALLDAERTYRALTGLDQCAVFEPEVLSERRAVGRDHPALALATAAVARAEARVAVTERTSGAATRVMIGTRRERPALGDVLDDSVGINLSVPIGGGAQRCTATSAATRVAAATRADLAHATRKLSLALHEAAHGLEVVRDSAAVAREGLTLAERQRAMGELAYEKGELELVDVLRLQETERTARRQFSRLVLEEHKQIALFNQAVGVVP